MKKFHDFILEVADEDKIYQSLVTNVKVNKQLLQLGKLSLMKKDYAFITKHKLLLTFLTDFYDKSLLVPTAMEGVEMNEDDVSKFKGLLIANYPDEIIKKLVADKQKKITDTDKFFFIFFFYIFFVMLVFLIGKSAYSHARLKQSKTVVLTAQMNETCINSLKEFYIKLYSQKVLEPFFDDNKTVDDKMEALVKFLKFFGVVII